MLGHALNTMPWESQAKTQVIFQAKTQTKMLSIELGPRPRPREHLFPDPGNDAEQRRRGPLRTERGDRRGRLGNARSVQPHRTASERSGRHAEVRRGAGRGSGNPNRGIRLGVLGRGHRAQNDLSWRNIRHTGTNYSLIAIAFDKLHIQGWMG